MAILSNSTQAILRQRVESAMTKDCIIRRTTFSTDSYGGPGTPLSVDVFSKTYLTRVQRTGADMVAAADSGRVHYMANLPYDADIRDGDAVIVDEIEYQTVQVIARHSNDLMRQALIVKAGS